MGDGNKMGYLFLVLASLCLFASSTDPLHDHKPLLSGILLLPLCRVCVCVCVCGTLLIIHRLRENKKNLLRHNISFKY